MYEWTNWSRWILPTVLLVIGLSVGAIIGPSSSNANNGSCVSAIQFAYQEIEASADFATKMVEYLDASDKADVAGMETAMSSLAPINERTLKAIDGFVETAPECK